MLRHQPRQSLLHRVTETSGWRAFGSQRNCARRRPTAARRRPAHLSLEQQGDPTQRSLELRRYVHPGQPQLHAHHGRVPDALERRELRRPRRRVQPVLKRAQRGGWRRSGRLRRRRGRRRVGPPRSGHEARPAHSAGRTGHADSSASDRTAPPAPLRRPKPPLKSRPLPPKPPTPNRGRTCSGLDVSGDASTPRLSENRTAGGRCHSDSGGPTSLSPCPPRPGAPSPEPPHQPPPPQPAPVTSPWEDSISGAPAETGRGSPAGKAGLSGRVPPSPPRRAQPALPAAAAAPTSVASALSPLADSIAMPVAKERVADARQEKPDRLAPPAESPPSEGSGALRGGGGSGSGWAGVAATVTPASAAGISFGGEPDEWSPGRFCSAHGCASPTLVGAASAPPPPARTPPPPSAARAAPKPSRASASTIVLTADATLLAPAPHMLSAPKALPSTAPPMR
eukprot:scaffold2959_cov107-Isochrysis_galbana.AAC.2